MKTPEIFIPRKRLEIPLDLDDLVDIELIRESKPMMASMRAVTVLKLHYPEYPIWESDHDVLSGKIYIVDTETGEKRSQAIAENGKPIVPYSTDGTIFRHGEEKVLSYGVLHPNDTVHVWWGISTFDLTQEQTPENALTILSYIDSDEYRAFDLRRNQPSQAPELD